MNIELLIERLRLAKKAYTFVELGVMCDLSHEEIRQILKRETNKRMRIETYFKLEKGLSKNGF